MPKDFKIDHVATAPRGWRVRTVKSGDHLVRIAFPPGRKETGSGHVVEILHPHAENPNFCPGRARMTNPAELILMGANPLNPKTTTKKVGGEQRRRASLVEGGGAHRSRRFNGKKFAIRWHTGTLSPSFESESEARSMLAKFHGKGEIVRVNPMPLRRRNPMAAEDTPAARDAIAIREGFIHRDWESFDITSEPHIPTGDYAQLGTLNYLAVKPEGGGAVLEISKEGDRIKVIADTTRRRIYFAGGHQALAESEVAQFTDDERNEVDLGECRQIGYDAVKYHPEVGNEAAGKMVLWDHKFGEESGVKPHAWYNRRLKKLLLKGGEYRVEDAGIVN